MFLSCILMFINSHAIHPSHDLFYTPSRHNWQFIYIDSNNYKAFETADGCDDLMYISPDIVLCIKKALVYLMDGRNENSEWKVVFESDEIHPPAPGWEAMKTKLPPRDTSIMMSLSIGPSNTLEYRLFYSPLKVKRDRECRSVYELFKAHYRTFNRTTAIHYTDAQKLATQMTARLILEHLLKENYLALPDMPYEYLLCRLIT